MSQVKLLKINASGVPEEMNTTADDVTLNSYTVQGGGPVLGTTGLDMNNTDVSDVQDLNFTDPSTGTINQTVGTATINQLMVTHRNNSMATTGAVLFPTVTDAAGELDSFKLPNIAGAPTATPAFSATAGYLVYDSTNKNLYAWDGVAWDNLNTVTSSNNLDNTYTADEDLAARDALYISAANNVSKASASADASAQLIGFATAAALDTTDVIVRDGGILGGFTALTAGARYFLATTAGTISSSAPTGAGNNVVQAGFAKSTTALHIQIQFLGKRS